MTSHGIEDKLSDKYVLIRNQNVEESTGELYRIMHAVQFSADIQRSLDGDN